MSLRLFGAFVGILISTIGFSQNGTTNFQVLQTISPARIAALGGNAIAIKDGDLNLGMIAPSLLDTNSTKQIALGYTRFFGEANIGHAAYAHHFDNVGTISASIQNLGYGSFSLTDEAGNVQGTFNAGEYIFQVGIGRQLTDKFSIGANVKYILSELAEYKASALAADLSGTYHNPESQFTATVMMKNIGRSVSSYTQNARESLPFEIQAAISKKLDKAPLRFALIGENLQTWDLTPGANDVVEIDPLTGEEIEVNANGFGENLLRHLVFTSEILLTDNFHIRFGYNYNRRQQLKIEDRPGAAGITYGIGLRIAKMHLSYARAAYSLAGVSNHFGISVKFEDFRKS
jgi:hypothetical protein